MVVLGDLNARVGNEVSEGIVGQHGVPGRNESGERLLEKCTEQELVVGNSWFKKNYVYNYTWLRMVEGVAIKTTPLLCVVTKTNAWVTVRCKTVERRRWRNV